MTTRLVLALGPVCMGTSGAVLGHHTLSAEFDENKPLEMTGTVTKVEWI